MSWGALRQGLEEKRAFARHSKGKAVEAIELVLSCTWLLCWTFVLCILLFLAGRTLQFQMSQVFMRVQPEKYEGQKNQVSMSDQLKNNPEQESRRRACWTA